MKQLCSRHALALAGLLLTWLLKLHYSSATPEQLRWVLAPTTALTSLLLQRDFSFAPGEGYLSRELAILISPACAGINFMIVAFLSLLLGFGQRFDTWRRRGAWLAGSLCLAYAVTLVVNALRIVLSVALGHYAARTLGVSFESVHRLLGVAVYLAGLVALCLTVQHWLSSRRASIGRRRVLLVALACYAAMTLLIPLLRGAGATPEFWPHAAPVSVAVVVSAALLFAAGGRTWDDGRHAIRSSEHPQRLARQPRPFA